MTMTPEDTTRQTIHDYMGSLAFMQNGPKNQKPKMSAGSAETKHPSRQKHYGTSVNIFQRTIFSMLILSLM